MNQCECGLLCSIVVRVRLVIFYILSFSGSQAETAEQMERRLLITQAQTWSGHNALLRSNLARRAFQKIAS